MNSKSNQAPELKRADTNEAPTADDDRLEKAPARLADMSPSRSLSIDPNSCAV